MRWALLVAALVVSVAFAAQADIRRLMNARGYATLPAVGACSGGCGVNVTVEDARAEAPIDTNGCTFPATMPCTMN